MKPSRAYKLPSGALQLTVFIGVLIALLLAGLLLLAFTHRNFAYQSKAGIDVVKSCNDGIRYLKTERAISFDTIILKQPDAEQKDRPVVKMRLSFWGLFTKASVVAVHRKKKFIKTALLGSTSGQDRVALYLQETFKPLALAGATAINGDAALPKMGVKPGYIAGSSFFGDELLHGNIGESSQTLPVLERDLKKESRYYISYARAYPVGTDKESGLRNPLAVLSLVAVVDRYREINHFLSSDRVRTCPSAVTLPVMSMMN